MYKFYIELNAIHCLVILIVHYSTSAVHNIEKTIYQCNKCEQSLVYFIYCLFTVYMYICFGCDNIP